MISPGPRSGRIGRPLLVVSLALAAACSSTTSTTATTLGSSAGATSAATVAGTSAASGASATTAGATAAPTSARQGGVSPTTAAASGVTSVAAAPAAPFVGRNADPERFDAALFATAAAGENTWFPLTAGFQATKEGGVTKGSRRLPHRRVVTITDVTKVIAGVTTVLMLDQDFDGGELAEQAIDYLAQDSQGNIWYLGSYTEAYEGGQFVDANDAWLAGVNGAKAGVLMMSDPKPGSPKYRIATIPGQGTDSATVVDEGQEVCVPFDCYTGVLVIREGSEKRYFAAGAGEIKLEPISGDPQETEEVVNLTQLTGQGLAELSAEAIRLDEHARTEAPKVFGDSAVAARRS